MGSSINEIIKTLRNKRDLTQEELAHVLKCKRQKIADWERGKAIPSVNDVIMLSQYFNVSTDYILGLTDVETSETELKSVCEYLGLSENTIIWLKKMNAIYKPILFDNNAEGKKITEEYITKGYFHHLLLLTHKYKLALDEEEQRIKKGIAEIEERRRYEVTDMKFLSENDAADLILFRVQENDRKFLFDYYSTTIKEIALLREDFEKVRMDNFVEEMKLAVQSESTEKNTKRITDKIFLEYEIKDGEP